MWNSLRVGWFLAVRQIRRSSRWTTGLIIFVMMLTFLNLVVVSGILNGLPAGASESYLRQYSGDIFIRNLPTKSYIERSQDIIETIRSHPSVIAVSPRYVEAGIIEANYRNAVGPNENPDQVVSEITGINITEENKVTEIGQLLLEGENLRQNEEGYILIGKNLLDQYSLGMSVVSATTLKGVTTGSRVRLRLGNAEKEMIVRGVLGSKIGEVSGRVIMSDLELRRMLGRSDLNVDEIAVKLRSDVDPLVVRDYLRNEGYTSYARIDVSEDAQGSFLDDIKKTFFILTSVIGGIGLAVASITVFIVIFINAVTRRKYIGILKGIGISETAIEFSYVLQSMFYALVGSLLGLFVLYQFLVPYFMTHPIDFPFSDGLLLAPVNETLIRTGLILLATMIAGYIPARMIVGRNTLNSILGR